MEKTIKVNSSKTLSSIIEKIVSESIEAASLYANGMEEKEKQKMLGEEDDKKETKTSSKSMDDEKEKLKKGKVKPEDIVDKLNTIRSGKSFKDEQVSSKLSEYIESLSDAEKVALLAFLKGISQVVTGEIDPQKASDPSKAPSNVEMKKIEDKKITIKPTVIKKPGEEKAVKSSSVEDTSGPTPIKPVKK